MDTVPTYRILSVDAWRDGGGWQWNNWFHVGDIERTASFKPRPLLRELRERMYLSPRSVGRVAVEDDGYNIVIKDKNTGEPLFAIEYGSVDP